MVGNLVAGRHTAGEIAKLFILICWQQGDKDRHWAWCGLLKLQSPPPETHFFQQGHTYSNEATPPNPSRTVLLLDD